MLYKRLQKQRSFTSRGTNQVFVEGFETNLRQEYMAGVQGRSTWQEYMAGVHGRSTRQEYMAGVHGRSTWQEYKAGVHYIQQIAHELSRTAK